MDFQIMTSIIQSAKKTALVTGAQGFIGRHLARELSKNGFIVYGLGHGMWPEADFRSCGLTRWINGEIVQSNLRLIQKSFGTPTVVFHLAGGSSVGLAHTNPREDFFRTVATTTELLDWIRLDAIDTQLVAVSSAAVYGSAHLGPIVETSTVKPCSPYGYHKYLMEELCRSYAETYGVNVVIARLFSVYGCGLRKQLLWDICNRLSEGTENLRLAGTGDELRDWIDVRDVVRALAYLAEKSSNSVPVFNVGTGIGISVKDVATAITEYWSNTGHSIDLSFSGERRSGDPFSLVSNSDYLRLFGFEYKFEFFRGVVEYIDWYRTVGVNKW